MASKARLGSILVCKLNRPSFIVCYVAAGHEIKNLCILADDEMDDQSRMPMKTRES